MALSSRDIPSAFVVMPFDAEFQNVYDKLIVPALQNAGYVVKRADSDLDQQNVLKDVVRGVAGADLVIAELTARNPNVLYELGLSHALRRSTVLITQSMDEVPFDLRAYRVIRYSTQFDTAGDLSTELEAIGKAHLKGEIEFGSPIIDFLPDPVPPEHKRSDSPSSNSDEENPSDQPPPSDEPEEGFLDAILSIASAGTQLTERLQRIGVSTEGIGEQFQASTAEVEAVQSVGGPGVVVKAHRIAGEMAEALDSYAEELAAEAPLLEENVQQLISSGLAFTSWLASQDEIDVEEAKETRDSLADLGKAVGEGLQGIRGFRKTLAQLSGISKDMARGTGRAIASLDGIASSLEQVEAFTKKATDLLDEHIPNDSELSSGDDHKEQNGDNETPPDSDEDEDEE